MGKVTKLSGPDPGPFSETTAWRVLSCGNIEVNSNKYYAIEIQRNPSTGEHRIYTEYGRINVSHVYESRGPFYSEEEAQHEFDKIVKAKQRGKTGGTSQYSVVDIITPTVGSYNIRGRTQAIKVDNTREIITQSSHKFAPDVMRLLNQFADENIHKITSSTSMSFTSHGLETALGPVTESHVQRAREELQAIQSIVKAAGGQIQSARPDFISANNRYFSLIPHTFGRKITESDWIANDAKLIEEFDLLDQLEAAVKLGLKSDSTTPQEFGGLDTEMLPIDMKPFYEMVEKTKAHSHLRSWRVKNAYEVKIPKERQRFEAAEKKYGNHMDFFHGSTNCNFLSILLNGLIIPGHGDGISIAGRMFGNGVYGASSSTKSLNYSVGSWTGKRNKYPNAFLLRVKFAMGKIYEPTRACSPPPGYHSTAAYAHKTGLQNDEFIIYSLEQCTITHLLELEQK
jgi:poly [ADP-ribose] polymerase 2/3/4